VGSSGISPLSRDNGAMTGILPDVDSNGNQQVDIALRRYEILIKYYIYENTVNWSRHQFFAALGAGLLAFFVSALSLKLKFWATIVAGLGIVQAILWILTGIAALYWMERWDKLCRHLEPIAFGDIEVFRNSVPPKGDLIKPLALVAAWASLLLWAIAFFYAALWRVW
jgi:hypothetical protein